MSDKKDKKFEIPKTLDLDKEPDVEIVIVDEKGDSKKMTDIFKEAVDGEQGKAKSN